MFSTKVFKSNRACSVFAESMVQADLGQRRAPHGFPRGRLCLSHTHPLFISLSLLLSVSACLSLSRSLSFSLALSQLLVEADLGQRRGRVHAEQVLPICYDGISYHFIVYD